MCQLGATNATKVRHDREHRRDHEDHADARRDERGVLPRGERPDLEDRGVVGQVQHGAARRVGDAPHHQHDAAAQGRSTVHGGFGDGLLRQAVHARVRRERHDDQRDQPRVFVQARNRCVRDVVVCAGGEVLDAEPRRDRQQCGGTRDDRVGAILHGVAADVDGGDREQGHQYEDHVHRPAGRKNGDQHRIFTHDASLRARRVCQLSL